MNLAPTSTLGNLPVGLRAELIAALDQVIRNFREARWEPSELNGGKLCEVVYTIIRGMADGTFPNSSSKPRNMVDACKALESEAQLSRSLRIQIPRMLVALYEVRNNRGVGHVGGEVDPNKMDATTVVAMSKWLVAELVRVFHAMDASSAADAVDALIERDLPIIWEVNGKKRVLAPKLSLADKTLLLLYSEPGEVAEGTLRGWVEASNPTAYRRDILQKAHRARLIEYDAENRTARISPSGMRVVENELLPRIALQSSEEG